MSAIVGASPWQKRPVSGSFARCARSPRSALSDPVLAASGCAPPRPACSLVLEVVANARHDQRVHRRRPRSARARARGRGRAGPRGSSGGSGCVSSRYSRIASDWNSGGRVVDHERRHDALRIDRLVVVAELLLPLSRLIEISSHSTPFSASAIAHAVGRERAPESVQLHGHDGHPPVIAWPVRSAPARRTAAPGRRAAWSCRRRPPAGRSRGSSCRNGPQPRSSFLKFDSRAPVDLPPFVVAAAHAQRDAMAGRHDDRGRPELDVERARPRRA